MDRNRKIEKRTLFRLFIAFVVIIAPLVLIFGSLSFFRTGYRQRLAQDHFSRAGKKLQAIRRASNDQTYIQKRLNIIYGLLSEERIRPEIIQKFLDRAKSEGLGFVNFRFFDENCRHIPLKGESDLYRTFIKKIFSALVQSELEHKTEMLVSHRSFFETFLGAVTPADLVNEKSGLINVKLNGKPGNFYWNSLYSHLENGRFKGGMVAFFENAEVPADFALARMLGEIDSSASPGEFFGVWNHKLPDHGFFRKDLFDYLSMSGDVFSGLLKSMREDFSGNRALKRGLLTIVPLDSDRTLFCFRQQRDSGLLHLIFLVQLLLLAGAVACLRQLFNLMVAKEFRFSGASVMRWAIAASAGLPLFALVVSGSYLVFIHGKVVEQELSDRLTGIANAVDERYLDELSRLENDYRALVDSVDNASDRGDYRKLASELYSQNGFRQMLIVSKSGRLNYSFPEKVFFGGLIGRLLPPLAQRLFAGREKGFAGLKGQIGAMMFDAMSKNLGELLGDAESQASFFRIFERAGRLNEFWLANQKFYIYTGFLDHKDTGAEPELMILWHEAAAFSESYLKKQVKRHCDFNSSEVSASLAMKSRRADVSPFPAELTKYSFSAELFEKVVSTENQQFAVVPKDGENWLVVASPLKRVPGHILFTMQSMRQCEEEQFFMKLLLVLAVIVTLLLCAGLVKVAKVALA